MMNVKIEISIAGIWLICLAGIDTANPTAPKLHKMSNMCTNDEMWSRWYTNMACVIADRAANNPWRSQIFGNASKRQSQTEIISHSDLQNEARLESQKYGFFLGNIINIIIQRVWPVFGVLMTMEGLAVLRNAGYTMLWRSVRIPPLKYMPQGQMIGGRNRYTPIADGSVVTVIALTEIAVVNLYRQLIN